MKSQTINHLLVGILIAGGVFFVLRTNDLVNKVNELQLHYATLQTSYNNLQSGYNALDSNYRVTLQNYNSLDANYNILQTNYNYLQTDLQSLRTDYNSLESEYNKLKSEISALRSENNQLERKNSDLQSIIDEYEKVPHSYYSTDAIDSNRNTWERLARFLSSEFRLPAYYEEHVFDCSESSAYEEWALENEGFMADIVVGPNPSGEAGYHAWVIVKTIDYQVAIEATALTGRGRYVWFSWGRVPGVIYSEDKLIDGWENYYQGYDESFKNIYRAIRQSGAIKEWDWWDLTSNFKQI